MFFFFSIDIATCPTYRRLFNKTHFQHTVSMLHIIVKKINSFHLNLYLTSDAQDSSSDTISLVPSLSGTSSNTNSKNLLQFFFPNCSPRLMLKFQSNNYIRKLVHFIFISTQVQMHGTVQQRQVHK